MKKKIFRSMLAISLAVVLASVALIVGVLYEYFIGVQKSTLGSLMSLAAQGVEKDGLAYFGGLGAGSCRLTWVAADGKVLADNEADAAAMENHAGREEIAEALASGTGTSTRMSVTLAEQTIYYAQRLTDGTVLRVSVTRHTAAALVLGVLQPILIILLAAFVLSFWLSGRVSRRVTEPLNRLNLDRPLENDTYEELAPLLTRIEHLRRQIDIKVQELRDRETEFTTVTENMNEGLVLLNEQGMVLSMNRAAEEIFGADPDSAGKDFLTVERDPAVTGAVQKAIAGSSGECRLDRNGRGYQIEASPIRADGRLTGAALLAFDVTEKALAEQQRIEFTANVSHELKTPLQSIMGSAELIENGLVKPEDLTRFAGRIRSESRRLMNLIEDILQLSRLDEGSAMPFEPVDLSEIAGEAVRSLGQSAEAHGVSVSLHAAKAPMTGVRRLLYEIVYNLCDNAIRYNHRGGLVDVGTAVQSDGRILLTVSDNGIGIPPEHQSRIFERFYRVDKSHSRETGGTGLGLSIVKHAVLVHHGAIQLQSEVGKGTRIVIRFPAERPVPEPQTAEAGGGRKE